MDTKAVIERIAKERNMTPEEVENEIRRSIRDAMKTKDPKAQMLWKQIAPDGKEPSIDKFLRFCVGMLNERKEKWYK